MIKKQVLPFALTAAALCLAGCTSAPSRAPDTQEKVKLTDDMILAVRYSTAYWNPMATTYSPPGNLLLAKSDGSFKAVDIDFIGEGSIKWGSDRIYLGSLRNEYQFTKEGLINIERKRFRVDEKARFLDSEGNKSISVYDGGSGSEDAELQHIVISDEQGKLSELSLPKDTVPSLQDKSLDAVASCGESLIGIYRKNSIEEVESEKSDLVNNASYTVAQIFPVPKGQETAILGTFENKEKARWDFMNKEAVCASGKMYSFVSSISDRASDYDTVLDLALFEFDINTGKHKTISLAAEGKTVLTNSELLVKSGHVSADKKSYIWVSEDQIVRSVDLQTGVVKQLFEMDVNLGAKKVVQGELGESEYPTTAAQVTEKSVFVLQEIDENTRAFKFMRYDLATGKKTEYMQVQDVNKIFHKADDPAAQEGYLMPNYVMGFVMNPAWVAELERG